MYHFTSTTGIACEQIEVTFEFDELSNITYDIEVKWQGKEVSGLLTEEQNNEIEMACCAYYRKQLALEIVNFNYDRGEELAKDRQFWREKEAA